jgi:ParB family transcriptional regulator, chromosome partitioning protein
MNILIPFSKLSISENNVRATNGNAEIESLAANIAKNGIIQNLIVHPDAKKGYYKVYAGGRRLRAIAHLIETNRLPKTFQLPCIVREASDNTQQDISLSENMMRIAMTAADECKAFAKLADANVSEEEISKTFGCDIRHVRMRLRLGQLAQPLFAALSSGELSIDAAKCYGLTGDHQKQETVWNALKNRGDENSKYAIRNAILDNSVSSHTSLALFVGEDAYREAGGRIELDLFSENEESQWLDGHIVTNLAEAKMIEAGEQIKIENNLGWIKTSLQNYVDYNEISKFAHYPRPRIELTNDEENKIAKLQEQSNNLHASSHEMMTEEEEDLLGKQLDKIEEEIDAITNRQGPIPQEDQPNVGIFVFLNREGMPQLHHHLLTTQMPKRSNMITDDNSNEPTARETHSRKLIEELAITRRDILALHIANDAQLALDLVIFKMALSQLSYDNGRETGLSLTISNNDDPRQGAAAPATDAAKTRERMLEELDTSWFKENDYIKSFASFRDIAEENKVQWLAYTMSCGLKASLHSEADFQNPFQDYLGTICEIDTAQHWRPTKDNYFGSVRRDTILEIISSLGDPTLAPRYAAAKKAELAEAAEKIFSGKALIEPDTKQNAIKWVPKELRFSDQAEAPVQNNPKTTKNAAELVIAAQEA